MRIPVLLAFALISTSPMPPERPSHPPVASPVTAELPADATGCWLNFRAKNTGSASVYIDMEKSKMATYSGVWRPIINTPNVTIPADGDYKKFTVWARLCGGNIGHVTQLYLKRGSETASAKVQGRVSVVKDMGDVSRHF